MLDKISWLMLAHYSYSCVGNPNAVNHCRHVSCGKEKHDGYTIKNTSKYQPEVKGGHPHHS